MDYSSIKITTKKITANGYTKAQKFFLLKIHLLSSYIQAIVQKEEESCEKYFIEIPKSLTSSQLLFIS